MKKLQFRKLRYLVDTTEVDDESVSDDQVQTVPGGAICSLTHAFADSLPTTELDLVTIDCLGH